MTDSTTSNENVKKTKKKDSFFSPSLFVLIFLILCFRWSIASPYHVPTASMEPTIKVGDRLLAWKLAYEIKIPFTDNSLFSWSEPQRGDIIVFRYPKEPDIDYVKRVIGLPGDRIKIREDILYINGKMQKLVSHENDRSVLADIDDNPQNKKLFVETLGDLDHWVLYDKNNPFRIFKSDFPADGEYIVPDNSYFVMGDNRDNSTDSRIWGPVPHSYVRGKAMFVLWSLFSSDDSLIPSLRWKRFGHVLN